MRISIYPSYTSTQKKGLATKLARILKSPTLSGTTTASKLPPCRLFIDEQPTSIDYGYWEASHRDNTIYLPLQSTNVALDVRFAILGSLSLYFGLDNEATVIRAMKKGLETVIRTGKREKYNLIVSSREPKQMAFAPGLNEVAALLDGQWCRPDGTIIKGIPPTWIVMDC